MEGLRAIPSKLKGKQLALSSEKSDAEYFLGLNEILIEPEGIYQHTQAWTRAIALIDNNLLARGIKANDEHSAIIESHSSNSYEETRTFTYMAGTPEEVARRF